MILILPLYKEWQYCSNNIIINIIITVSKSGDYYNIDYVKKLGCVCYEKSIFSM